MRYRLLGRSGLKVSELALGTMTFGEEWGWGASRVESRAVFDTFTEAGGNFIDTANRYTDGTSEKLVGEFIASERERFVLGTKFTLFTRRDHPNASGNSRKSMVESLEASLRRLGTDYVDLYWVHAWDFLTPVEEVMRSLDDLVRAGKVLYAGISDTPAWLVSRANTLAELRGWTPFVGLQIEYSLIQRHAERELLPMAQSLELGVTAWGPLGGGMLSGKYRARAAGGPPMRMEANPAHPRLSDRNLAIADQVAKVSAETGRSATQVALSWLRGRPAFVIPILGARNAAQLRENLASLDLELSPEHRARLDEASHTELGFPHDFLAGDNIRDLVYGGFDAAIDRPDRRS